MHSSCIFTCCQITEEKEKEKPASSSEKTKELSKKDESTVKEKGMYDDDDSDDDKVLLSLFTLWLFILSVHVFKGLNVNIFLEPTLLKEKQYYAIILLLFM